MLKNRRCDICKSRLAGKKGHGFVVDNGRMIVCSDYRRHNRIRKGLKFNYGEDYDKKEDEES